MIIPLFQSIEGIIGQPTIGLIAIDNLFNNGMSRIKLYLVVPIRIELQFGL